MNENGIKELWIDKYCPQSLDNYLLNDSMKQYFKNMIDNSNLQNFTLAGIQGSGKTSLVKILCKQLNAEVLFVKCATEGTIDVLRSKVEPFCDAMSFDNRCKIVVLDEVDSASANSDSSFQKGLRTLIESAQDTCRFLLTCNYKDKIIPAVLSRCPIVNLSYSQKDLCIHIKKILDAEKIVYDKETLKKFIEIAIKYYPDTRRIINYLQLCCNDGKSLIVNVNTTTEVNSELLVNKLVNVALTEKNIIDVRQFYIREKDIVSDYNVFAMNVFNYLVDNNKISEEGIIQFSDFIYQLNQIVDKESFFFKGVVLIRKFANNGI